MWFDQSPFPGDGTPAEADVTRPQLSASGDMPTGTTGGDTAEIPTVTAGYPLAAPQWSSGWAAPTAPPPPPPAATQPGRPPVRRLWRLLAVIALVCLLATGGSLGYLTAHNGQLASTWKHRYVAQVAATKRVTAQLATANDRISTLNGQVNSLNGTVSSLQGQLSTVANQKEKALDTASALQQLLSAAGVVANALQQCVTATNQFDQDLNNAVLNGNSFTIDALLPEANAVDRTCGQAENANTALQSAIQSAP